MHIFMTNDDGYEAPGLVALARRLSAFGRLTIVAPDGERSSCSHSLTLRQYVRLKRKKSEIPNATVYAATGTTADCGKIGLEFLLKEDKPDLIVSGMNNGFNAGSDCLYSGTVAGAMESVFQGIPALAASVQTAYHPDLLGRACDFAADVVEKMFIHGRFQGLINLNIPEMDDISWREVKVARLGLQRYESAIREVKDPSGHMGYWISGKMKSEATPEEDVYWVHRKKITMTPITWQMTNQSLLPQLAQKVAALTNQK